MLDAKSCFTAGQDEQQKASHRLFVEGLIHGLPLRLHLPCAELALCPSLLMCINGLSGAQPPCVPHLSQLSRVACDQTMKLMDTVPLEQTTMLNMLAQRLCPYLARRDYVAHP